MKRGWQRDVNRQLSLRNGCMHTQYSHFPAGSASFLFGKDSVYLSLPCVPVQENNCKEEKFFMLIRKKKKNKP